jgi:hypothetical protein
MSDNALVHRLQVDEAFDVDDPLASFHLIHDPSCPVEQHNDDVIEYLCQERFEQTETGLDAFFIHRADPDEASSYQTRLEPGIYEVKAWARKYDVPGEPIEWDAGLDILDEPREPNPREQVPPKESHQHWVWLRSETSPPHWEIRGTGALLDPDSEREFLERRARLAAEQSRLRSGVRFE